MDEKQKDGLSRPLSYIENAISNYAVTGIKLDERVPLEKRRKFYD